VVSGSDEEGYLKSLIQHSLKVHYVFVNRDVVVQSLAGPTNYMTKYEVTPWPILTAGKPVNATLTFTPGKALLDL